MKTLLHVDMDAFFASAEVSRHPEWRGKPLIIGSLPDERGVVSTCSYEARSFGVRSAMPSAVAYRLCPHGLFVPPDMAFYNEVSAKVFSIFGDFSPYVEGVSIDEAFLDITGMIHLFGSARSLVIELKRRIKNECRITCSVGIASNRLLAKIGSENDKPDGITEMPREAAAIREFLAPKPLSVLWGVGAKMVEVLKKYGISICRDIQELEEEKLAAVIGANAARNLKAYSFGISDDAVHYEESDEKSVSREWTFPADESSRHAVKARLLELVDDVGYRFRRKKRWACTAKIKLRDNSFVTKSRQGAFSSPSCDNISFRHKAIELLDDLWPEFAAHKPIRLVGFGVCDIQNFPKQDEFTLFPSEHEERQRKNERLSAALDDLKNRGLL